MEFKVGLAHPEDMAQISAVIFRAHRGENPYINAVHPQNLTKEGQEKALKKLSSFADTSDRSIWEKVTATATGEIVGAAVWLVYDTKKPAHTSNSDPKPPSIDGNDEEAEFAAALNASLAQAEAPFWADNNLPLINLFVLAVAPEYQYRGVGTLLMNSGLASADKIGAKCTVMSTDAARWLYEKSGFAVQRHVTLQVPEKFVSRPAVRLFWMTRERK